MRVGLTPEGEPGTPSRSASYRFRTGAARWCLTAVLLVGAMVPWYALRLLPVATIGSAKINVLDVLVALTVLVALPDIAAMLLRGPRAVVWVCAFLGYAAIPLAIGLHDHEARFFAIREARPLAFYALALAVVAGSYTPRDFHRFAGTFVAGATISTLAVLGHILIGSPLPGYPGGAIPAGQWETFFYYQVRYLEWTVPVTAFILGLAEALAAPTVRACIVWAASALVIAWYVLAGAERFMQALTVAALAALLWLRAAAEPIARRAALLGIVLVCLAALGAGVAAGPVWLRDPARATAYRWSVAFPDKENSLHQRVEELRGGLLRVARDPLFGIGLGGLVLQNDPTNKGLPWRYVSTGYGFLLIKMGLGGLGLYLAMVIAALSAALRRLRAGPAEAPRRVVVLGFVGMGMLLAFDVLYPAADTSEGVIAFSLFYGMLLSGDRGFRGGPAGDLKTSRR